MKKAIRRLRLRKGDILVVNDPYLPDRIMQIQAGLDFPVPIVFAPDGIRRFNREYLLKLLEENK